MSIKIPFFRSFNLSSNLIRSWSNVVAKPPDAILGLNEAFRGDPNPKKINLTVGAYRDDNGKPFVLDCVRRAENLIIEEKMNHEYPPLAGIPEFRTGAARLAFGDDSPVIKNKLVSTFQSVSGTGGLRLASEFLLMIWPKKEIFIPNPSWANHNSIFTHLGMKVNSYRYYDNRTHGLDFSGMMEDLQSIADESIVLLHACAHNPTGVDPSMDQWKDILDVLTRKKCCLFFDMAYQGYATGNLANDAAAVRYVADRYETVKSPMIVVQSFAKNMGLYGERAGVVNVISETPEENEHVMSNLMFIGRRLCSFPPIHGARIASKILNTPELNQLWLGEVKGMADRVLNMRRLLVSKLADAGSKRDWSHVEKQIGMFCFSGLQKSQVELLRVKYSIYMTNDGRVSVTGLNSGNIDYFVEAVMDVTT